MTYFMLLIEGIITFLSPCMLPMIPLYLSYFASQSSDNKTVVKEALYFVFGFTVIFVGLSIFVNTIGKFLLTNSLWINQIAGATLILLAIDTWYEHRWTSRIRTFQTNFSKQINGFLFGMIFAVTWTPCVGVYLASALTISITQSNLWESVSMILIYCLGLGLPFVLSAMLVEESLELINKYKNFTTIIQKIAAIILFFFGIMMVFDGIENIINR